MKKDEILNILIELRDCLDEFDEIMYESTSRQKGLQNKICELYGSIQVYYLKATGCLNIDVPIAGSKSTFNNYFEAGYLSGRSIHTHQGYTELVKVIGVVKNKNFNTKMGKEKSRKSFSRMEKLTAISVLLVLISGTFLFGKYIGENRFDQEKIDLTDKNKQLKDDSISLRMSLRITRDSILSLQSKIKEIPLKPHLQ